MSQKREIIFFIKKNDNKSVLLYAHKSKNLKWLEGQAFLKIQNLSDVTGMYIFFI